MNGGWNIPVNSGWLTNSFVSTAVVPSNATQMEVRLVWNTVGTAPASDGLYVGNVQLEAGTQFTGFEYRPAAVELGICQRFYSKTFPMATQPAQNTGSANGALRWVHIGTGAVTANAAFTPYPVPMRAVPAVTFYNPVAPNAQVRNLSTSVDCTATVAAPTSSERGLYPGYTGDAGAVTGNQMAVHWTADAEI
jgi:hypothetical protein